MQEPVKRPGMAEGTQLLTQATELPSEAGARLRASLATLVARRLPPKGTAVAGLTAAAFKDSLAVPASARQRPAAAGCSERAALWK